MWTMGPNLRAVVCWRLVSLTFLSYGEYTPDALHLGHRAMDLMALD